MEDLLERPQPSTVEADYVSQIIITAGTCLELPGQLCWFN